MARKSVNQVKKEQAADDNAAGDAGQEQAADDSSVMQGGPGEDNQVIDDTGEKVAASDIVSIKVDGTEYKVSKDTAAILTAQQRQFDRVISEVKRPAPQSAAKKPADDEDANDVTVKFFADPKKFLDDFKTEILSTARQTMTAEYSQDQAQKQFWTDFYGTHKDLDKAKDHVLVEAVLRSNTKLLDMKVEDASKELADLTRKNILDLTNRHKQGNKENRTATLEGGSTGASRQTSRKEAADETPARASLSQLIKARKNARRAQTV